MVLQILTDKATKDCNGPAKFNYIDGRKSHIVGFSREKRGCIIRRRHDLPQIATAKGSVLAKIELDGFTVGKPV